MNGITKRCISFAQGNKDPFQRVNYPFGLVLGVDEFVDEQCYFLEKEYMHNRGLHGCGTVSGLHVTVEEEAGDIEARVSPGIGIDQYGRLFVVRTRQCASLESWLADQDLTEGDQTVYVVARYAECETELVPIAGQPCSSSEQLSAPSRIRDFFEIDFTLEPPPHAAHQAVLNLAEFLHRFRRDPSAERLPNLGTSQALAAIIGPAVIGESSADFQTQLNGAVEELTGTEGERLLRIPPPDVQPLLDDIFTYWVTEVRPTLSPDLITPSQPESSDDPPPPSEILLAQIGVTLPAEGDLVLENVVVDNSVRPYLLHTQLIQELFDVHDLGGEGGVAAPARPVLDFAIIEDVSVQILSLWIRIPNNLELVPNQTFFVSRIQPDGSLQTINFQLAEDEPRRNEVGRYFRLRTTVNLNNQDQLLFRFDTDSIAVETDDGRQSLTDFIQASPLTFANYQSNRAQLLAFHVVERADAPNVDPETIREIVRELIPPPPIPFVTITPLTVSDGGEDFLQAYELWFHLDGVVEVNEGAIEGIGRENVQLLVEDAPGSIREVPIEFNQTRPNVVEAFPSRGQERNLAYARFAFALDGRLAIRAFNPAAGGVEEFGTIREYIERTNQRLQGHRIFSEQFDEVLVVYVREQGRARRVE